MPTFVKQLGPTTKSPEIQVRHVERKGSHYCEGAMFKFN